MGAFGAFLYFRTHKTTLNFSHFLDALAPGVVIAQAIGRVGNWFNQELFGKPTSLPWGLEIDLRNRPTGFENYLTFHPTFMYEAIWCLLVAYILIKLPIFFKRIIKNQGDVFALYVCGYTLGRLWIEALRIDDANYVLGLRLNIWVSFIVIASSVVYLIRSNRRGYLSNTQSAS
jgi:prolipoprotein diacylglyceryl transferase